MDPITRLCRTLNVTLPEEVAQDRLHVGAGPRVPTKESCDGSPDRDEARGWDEQDAVTEVDEQLHKAAAVDDLVVAAAAVEVRVLDSNHYRSLRSP